MLTATVTGSFVVTYEGSGELYSGSWWGLGMDVSHFSVYSKGVGASSGRRMTLKRWGAQVLPEGTYPLEPIDLNIPSTTGVTAVYTTENDES